MGMRTRIVLVVAGLLLVVGGAWALQAKKGGATGQGSSGSGYSIAVSRGGAVLRRFTVADLQALPQTAETIEGKTQNGPLVGSVLQAADAGDYTKLTITGAGVRDSGKLTLTAPHIPADLMLDYSERGTVKACSPTLAWGAWVRDVTGIDVD